MLLSMQLTVFTVTSTKPIELLNISMQHALNHHNNIVVVGCGGIGHYAAPLLARYQAYQEEGTTLTFVDGDIIDDKNLARVFSPNAVGEKKASALMESLEDSYDGTSLALVANTQFVVPNNLYTTHKEWNQDGVVVFACVDNHKTRVFLQESLLEHDNATLVAGGNDFFAGQAHLWIRRNGVNLGPTIMEIAPDYLREDLPGNWFPGEEDCSQQYESEPQLVLTNSAVAQAMVGLFVSECVFKNPSEGYLNEVLINIMTGGSVHQFSREAIQYQK